MTKKDKRAEVRGAHSVVTEDQPSFVEEHGRRGKHFSGGKKTEPLDHVGASAPDADADPSEKPRRRAR
jgi:hypothetical protein